MLSNHLFRAGRRPVFFIWLGWALIMLGYQIIIPARLNLQRPDYALQWTPTETTAVSQRGKIYLNEPFLNRHVSWDSEYYLAIAVGGYADPNILHVGEEFAASAGTFWPFVIPQSGGSPRAGISLSYAFFPFYPLLIRLLALPLSLLGLNAIATATLAGVLISLLGTLAAALALYELGRSELGEAGGLRAVFYLLIFPSSFFLAQVYTEGLFIGLAFSSLLMLRRGHRGWAALLAVFATFTRAVGVVLVVPLLLSWLEEGEWIEADLEWRQIYFRGLPWKVIGHAALVLAPVFAFMLWRISYYGLAFNRVEEEYFGRGLLALNSTYFAWRNALQAVFGNNPQAVAYYFVEFVGIFLGFTACIVGFRRHRDLAWFGLLVVLLSFTSGPAQGMHRYVLAAPPLFLFLGRWGENPAFDRVWTIASILIMGMMSTMFMFDMWAG